MTSLEAELDRAWAAHPNPGRPLLRRLNRAEYANAVRDLLALDVDVASLLPPDNSAYGFDNIADVLGVSPSLQERYLAAAEKIGALAIGDPAKRSGRATPIACAATCRRTSTSKGCRSARSAGPLVRHPFPRDGEYTFQIRLFRTNFDNLRGIEYPHQIEITVDGERVHHGDDRRRRGLRRRIREAERHGRRDRCAPRLRAAGQGRPARVSIAFVENFAVVGRRAAASVSKSAADTLDWTGRPHIQIADDQRAIQGHRAGRHAEPAADFRLPAGAQPDGGIVVR